MRTRQQKLQAKLDKASRAMTNAHPLDDKPLADVFAYGNALLEVNGTKPLQPEVTYTGPQPVMDRRTFFEVGITRPWAIYRGFSMPWWVNRNIF